MSALVVLAPSPAATGFRAGMVALRIRRGAGYFLLPRAWVRSVVPLHDIVTLPRSNRWVTGLSVHDGRPIPVLDLAVCAGIADSTPTAGVLLGTPEQASFALVVADGPGRFISVPAAARLEAADSWLLRLQGCAQPTWWLEVALLAAELKE